MVSLLHKEKFFNSSWHKMKMLKRCWYHRDLPSSQSCQAQSTCTHIPRGCKKNKDKNKNKNKTKENEMKLILKKTEIYVLVWTGVSGVWWYDFAGPKVQSTCRTDIIKYAAHSRLSSCKGTLSLSDAVTSSDGWVPAPADETCAARAGSGWCHVNGRGTLMSSV